MEVGILYELLPCLYIYKYSMLFLSPQLIAVEFYTLSETVRTLESRTAMLALKAKRGLINKRYNIPSLDYLSIFTARMPTINNKFYVSSSKKDGHPVRSPPHIMTINSNSDRKFLAC